MSLLNPVMNQHPLGLNQGKKDLEPQIYLLTILMPVEGEEETRERCREIFLSPGEEEDLDEGDPSWVEQNLCKYVDISFIKEHFMKTYPGYFMYVCMYVYIYIYIYIYMNVYIYIWIKDLYSDKPLFLYILCVWLF